MGHFDALILGGGCAGLSLAVELLQRGYGGRLLIVEPRQNYDRDRTWGYWNVLPHAFEDAVSHRWSTWIARSQGRDAVQTSSRYAYEHIPADRFYASALARIDAAPDAELWLATRAGSPRQTATGFVVETSRGEVQAPLVFDSRPPPRSAVRSRLTQHFLGWEVRAQSPAFDPSRVLLMDFLKDQGLENAFCYLLPYSEHEALVEVTFLTPEPSFDQARLEATLRGYLDRRLGLRQFQVGYQEQGAIPMGAKTLSSGVTAPGYFPIGVRGGAVRASSGYAFLAIQRWSQRCAEAVASGRLDRIPTGSYSPIANWVDAVLLQRLTDEPSAIAETFVDFFGGAGPDATARFLADEAGARDYAEIIAALPFWPFLVAAAKLSFWPRAQGVGGRAPAEDVRL